MTLNRALMGLEWKTFRRKVHRKFSEKISNKFRGRNQNINKVLLRRTTKPETKNKKSREKKLQRARNRKNFSVHSQQSVWKHTIERANQPKRRKFSLLINFNRSFADTFGLVIKLSAVENSRIVQAIVQSRRRAFLRRKNRRKFSVRLHKSEKKKAKNFTRK